MMVGGKVMLWNERGPHAGVTCIEQSKCPLPLLMVCGVPDEAREILPNMTAGELDGTEVHVRGVDQTFLGVRVNNKNYYVNARFVRWV